MKGIVEEQHLFNLYVHLPPNKTLEGPPTIFNGHEIPGSIQTGESPSDVSPGHLMHFLADTSSNLNFPERTLHPVLNGDSHYFTNGH